jgi:AcrR family transcriptional regulator
VAAPTLRADAARNLELILEAADVEFAEKGHEASVAGIATRAGVGQATIFRRFETKDDLIAAVFERKVEQLLEAAETAQRKRRAWDGLMGLMATLTESQVRDRGFFQSMAHELLTKDAGMLARKEQMKEAVAGVVEKAKAQGDLRDDIEADDVYAFCCAAAQAAAMGPNAGPRAAKRYLAVITDGMRAPSG